MRILLMRYSHIECLRISIFSCHLYLYSLSVEQILKDVEEKVQTHLIFKMLVRAASAYIGLLQYDKNDFPHLYNNI